MIQEAPVPVRGDEPRVEDGEMFPLGLECFTLALRTLSDLECGDLSPLSCRPAGPKREQAPALQIRRSAMPR